MPYTFDQPELFLYDEKREQARALRRAGHTVEEIKARLGTRSNRKIQSWLSGLPASTANRRRRAKDRLRARARELRVNGSTYNEIAFQLGVSKSSCSLWCRDLPRPTPAPGKQRPSTWGPRLATREHQRAEAKRSAAEQVGEISARELLLLGIALYWAEGEKDKPYVRRERITFTNSDPSVVSLFIRWLDLVGVPKTSCVFRLQIHETADVAGAQAFWAELAGVDVADFAPPTVKRHNPKTNRRNRGDAYRGCLVIRVRQSARLYQRVEGVWQGIIAGVE